MIYTSYFGQLHNVVAQNIFPVSIALHQPCYYHGEQYLALAPTPEILQAYKRFPNIEKYTEAYTSLVLNKLNVFQVISELTSMAKPYKDIVLLCYEHPRDFCHRKLVANWIISNGYLCKEFTEEGVKL